MTRPLDIGELTEASREFAVGFLGRFPGLHASCSAETIAGVPGRHLLIRIVSPAGEDRNVTIWMEGGDEPSLAFGSGGWHTHDDFTRQLGPNLYQDESLFDLLEAILDDQFVVFEEPDAEPRPFRSVLDLRAPNAVIEEITNPHCSDRFLIKTFSGRGDREVSLADFRG